MASAPDAAFDHAVDLGIADGLGGEHFAQVQIAVDQAQELLRGEIGIGDGQGAGLTPRTLGESSGQEQVTLNTSQLPAHTHTVTAMGSAADASLVSPANGVPATKTRTTLYAPGPGSIPMAPVTSSATGGNQPVPVMQPYLVINCFIATQGVYPARP